MEFIQLPPRESLLYTSCYCEENTYKLVQLHVDSSSLKHYTVIFLSNPTRTIPVFSQRAQRAPILPVVWDYHVILIYHPAHTLLELLSSSGRGSNPDDDKHNETDVTKSYVYDLDTTLATFPCPFPTYFSRTFFPPPSSLFADPSDRVQMLSALAQDRFQRYFRLVPAESYLENFSSSRDHMKNSQGEWMMPPPVWDVIRSEKAERDNFPEYIDFAGCEGGTEDFEKGREYLGFVIGETRLWEVFGGGEIPSNELLDLETVKMPEAVSEGLSAT